MSIDSEADAPPTPQAIGMLWGSDDGGRVRGLAVYRVGGGYALVGSAAEYLTTDASLANLLAAAHDWFELKNGWIVLSSTSRSESPIEPI